MSGDEFSLYPGWMRAALCREADAEVFFPEKAAFQDQPLAVCERCPVRFECLRDALGQKDNPEGVWGGTTKRQRNKLRDQAEQTSIDEVIEMVRERAAKSKRTHCRNNHPFDAYNTRMNGGHPICRECRRDSTRKHREKAMAA